MASKRQKRCLQSTINESDLTYHEKLGLGESGNVYRVTWKSEEFGEKVAAAKKIPIVEGKSIDQQFGKEIYSLPELKHPNLIEYYGQVVTSTHVVIVTEYAAKGSLYDYLQDKSRLPEDLKLKWAIHAAKGIRYLDYTDEIKHFNIKSCNCLITDDNTLKLCDFGIAKDHSEPLHVKESVRWLAPEVFRDGFSRTAHIFAFGIVLWELVSCEEPYKGESEEDVMKKVLNDGFRPDIPLDCPIVLRSLMESCWHGHHRRRTNIDLVQQDLENFEDGRTFKMSETESVHLQHEIATFVMECQWINDTHLAVCSDREEPCVDIYEVNSESSNLAYTLTADDWDERLPRGIAVSEALPESFLMICDSRPYIYRFPCHEATQEMEKYRIQGGDDDCPCPLDLVANANRAFVVLYTPIGTKVVTCHLPDLNQQSFVELHEEDCTTTQLSINNDYLLVNCGTHLVVKHLDDLKQDLFTIAPPNEWWSFCGVAISNDAREIYAACSQLTHPCRVYKYTWDGIGTPRYANRGCIIADIEQCNSDSLYLSLSPGGLLAVGHPEKKVTVYTSQVGKIKVLSPRAADECFLTSAAYRHMGTCGEGV